MKWFSVVVLMAMAVTPVLGCSGSGDADDPDVSDRSGQRASFAATIAGSTAQSLTGSATSYSKGASNPGWALQLLTDDNQAITIASESGTRPVPGTYTIIDDMSFTGATPDGQYIGSATLGPDAYLTVSGTLVISESSASQVRGSFTFTARHMSGGGDQISVEGTFTSSNTDL